jgi:hypothetical protein
LKKLTSALVLNKPDVGLRHNLSVAKFVCELHSTVNPSGTINKSNLLAVESIIFILDLYSVRPPLPADVRAAGLRVRTAYDKHCRPDGRAYVHFCSAWKLIWGILRHHAIHRGFCAVPLNWRHQSNDLCRRLRKDITAPSLFPALHRDAFTLET